MLSRGMDNFLSLHRILHSFGNCFAYYTFRSGLLGQALMQTLFSSWVLSTRAGRVNLCVLALRALTRISMVCIYGVTGVVTG